MEDCIFYNFDGYRGVGPGAYHSIFMKVGMVKMAEMVTSVQNFNECEENYGWE